MDGESRRLGRAAPTPATIPAAWSFERQRTASSRRHVVTTRSDELGVDTGPSSHRAVPRHNSKTVTARRVL
jgi:hypothetical protein